MGKADGRSDRRPHSVGPETLKRLFHLTRWFAKHQKHSTKRTSQHLLYSVASVTDTNRSPKYTLANPNI